MGNGPATEETSMTTDKPGSLARVRWARSCCAWALVAFSAIAVVSGVAAPPAAHWPPRSPVRLTRHRRPRVMTAGAAAPQVRPPHRPNPVT